MDLRSTFVTVAIASLIQMLPTTHGQDANVAVKAVNSLGLQLLSKATDADANAVISPYSIQSALAMAYAGAAGVTASEMEKALHYPRNATEVHRSFSVLRQALDEIVQRSATNAAKLRTWGQTNEPVTLKVANRLFGQKGYDFRSGFLTRLRDDYAAPFEALDFANDSVAATSHINRWVEAQTNDRIRAPIPSGALGELTRLVLVNAVYMKAPWADDFPVSATKPQPFHVGGGEAVDVTTMTHERSLGYAKRNGFAVVAIPYSGWDLQFLILLPAKANGVEAIEKKLTPGMLLECTNLRQCELILHLPKFRIEPPSLALGAALRALGMKSAFDDPAGSANFDGIAPRRPNGNLAISEVFHKAFIEIDEKGTEAAAATAVAIAVLGDVGKPPKPIEVRVDHPFLFAVQHRRSGACLFLGRVLDPR